MASDDHLRPGGPRVPLAAHRRHRASTASFEETRRAIDAAGAEIVTVAVRRVNITDPGKENLLDHLPLDRFTILPNTAGCYTAEDAIRTCRLAREAGVGTLVKLEVIGDEKTLFPDVAGDDRGGARAGEGGLPGAALRHRRPGRLQAARGDRLRRGDAARRADRLGARHPQPVQPAHHHRAEPRAGDRRRRASAPRRTRPRRWSSAATPC